MYGCPGIFSLFFFIGFIPCALFVAGRWDEKRREFVCLGAVLCCGVVWCAVRGEDSKRKKTTAVSFVRCEDERSDVWAGCTRAMLLTVDPLSLFRLYHLLIHYLAEAQILRCTDGRVLFAGD